MDDATLTDTLERLGLSDKEIATYLSILDHGEAKASTIAEDAGVSKRYVYSVGEELEKRGFVEVNDHAVPTTLRARPPDEVVEHVTSELQSLGPALSARYNRAVEAEQQFEVIKSHATILKRLRQAVDRAEHELALALPAEVLPEIEAELEAAVSRGVLVLCLLTGENLTEPPTDFDERPFASVLRTWNEPAPLIVTVDTQAGLFASHKAVTRTNADLQAIHIAQEQLVPIAVGSFFGNYWPMASEVAVATPHDLPQSFTGESFRNGVFAATQQLNAGIEATTTLEVRRVGGPDTWETIHGRVVGTQQNLIEPTSDTFAVQNGLEIEIETEDDVERATVGGPGAFVEDFECRSVRLEYASEDD